MSKLQKKYIEDNAVDGSKIKLANNEYLRADSAITGEINLLKLNTNNHAEIGASKAFVGLNEIMTEAFKGVPNGIASLDGSGLVPASQLPSYVDDVEEYADFASLPGTGETGKIYVTLDDNKTYRWSGSSYFEISAGPATTDDLAEGVTNKYYSEANFDASLATKTF